MKQHPTTLLLCLGPLLIAALETKYNSSFRLNPYHRNKRRTCADESFFLWMNPLLSGVARSEMTINSCYHIVEQQFKLEYGYIVSPNYPLQYPMGRRRRNPRKFCQWFLSGFDTLLIIITDLSLRGSMSNNCAIGYFRTREGVFEDEGDQLFIGYQFAPYGQRPGRYRGLATLCGDYKNIPKDKLFFVVRKPPPGQRVWVWFRLYSTMNSKGVTGKRGFLITWMNLIAFPGQRLEEINHEYVLKDGTYIRSRNEIFHHGSYIQVFIPRDSGKLTTISGMTMFQGNRSSCHGRHMRVFDFAANKFLRQNITCTDLRGGGVDLSATYVGVAKQFAPYAFVISTLEQTVGYRGIYGVDPCRVAKSGCILYDGSSAKEDSYIYKNGATEPGDQCQYRANSHCTVDVSKHFNDQIFTFIQVRLRMSVEVSSECVYDYIQIGGLRLCGRHFESIAVPYDQSLTEIVGVFKNIAVKHHTYSITSSAAQDQSRASASVVVDGIVNQQNCYRSRNENRSPFWTMTFEEKLTIWAVSVKSDSGSSSYVLHGDDFELFVLDGGIKYYFDRGNKSNFTMTPEYVNTVFFRPPARGRAVQIKKKSPVLALCEVAIYINLADNNINTGGWTDRESSYVNNRYIAYTSSNVALRDRQSLPPNTTTCTYEKTFNSRKTARLKCRPSIPSKFVRVDSIRYPSSFRFHLCEVQVYATYADEYEGTMNVALYKFARQSSSTEDFPASRAVDGRILSTRDGGSCARITSNGASSYWVVDLTNYYDINGVVIHTASFGPHGPKGVSVLIHLKDPLETGETLKDYQADGQECAFHDREMQMGRNYSLECKHAYFGRYVQLISADKSEMILCEVEVMASAYVCGETIREADTVIRSPHFPLSYTAPGEAYVCQWVVPTSLDGMTVVEVRSMVLAPHDNTDCTKDILMLSNHEGEQKILCGFIMNQKFSFKAHQGSNFFVTLMVRTPADFVPTFVYTFELRVYSFADCFSKFLAAPEGAVASPDYPLAYPPGIECLWVIEVSKLSTVDVTITDIDTGENITVDHTRTTSGRTECLRDRLTINATESDGDHFWVICTPKQAQEPIQFVALNGTRVYFTFKSRNKRKQRARGFRFVYSVTPIETQRTKCGGMITRGRNYTNPLYPQKYAYLTSCIYQFSTPPFDSGLVTLTIYELNLGGGDKMHVDMYVDSNHTFIHGWRGHFTNVFTQQYKMRRFAKLTFTFFTDGTTRGLWNFNLDYITNQPVYGPKICGELFLVIPADASIATYTIAVPPRKPGTEPEEFYKPETSCDWYFSFNGPPPQNVIMNFTILWMDLEPTPRDCIADFVQIGERVICEMPPPGTGSVMLEVQDQWPFNVKFYSDADVQGRGFEMRVTVFPNGCADARDHHCFDGHTTVPCCKSDRDRTPMKCCLPVYSYNDYRCVPDYECFNYGYNPRTQWMDPPPLDTDDVKPIG